MEIQEKNIIAAYKVADENGQQMLRTLFPAVEFDKQEADNRPVTERIKTFDDALNALGEEHPFVAMFRTINVNFSYCSATAAMFAYAKLQVVCAALNEGWEPQFTDDETRWYPWHWLYTEEEIGNMATEEQHERCMMSVGDYQQEGWAGFASAGSGSAPSAAVTSVGSRLCLKSRELAAYCGTQFIDLWADFKLIRK